jgi:hypothetical protein
VVLFFGLVYWRFSSQLGLSPAQLLNGVRAAASSALARVKGRGGKKQQQSKKSQKRDSEEEGFEVENPLRHERSG